MKKILIFGSGGHAKVVIDIVEKSNEYQILGLIDSYRPPNQSACGYQVIGDESILLNIRNEIHGGIVAIGDNWVRKKVVEKILAIMPEFKFVHAVHPSAIIGSSVTIGDGTVVMGGTVINSNTSVSEHCVINTHSSVDHDCRIGRFVSIAPGSTLGGNVTVGDYTAISLGSKVIHSLMIGSHTVIGAGSTVVRDIGSNAVAYGTPAKIIRSRTIGEKYL
ncbi:acetyltransferase [Metabacillus idriensis]|uniref:acetyltransferase n=1 Tax=Metabacillus idriensis TaxID=324768 RepID=UPI003D27DFF4